MLVRNCTHTQKYGIVWYKVCSPGMALSASGCFQPNPRVLFVMHKQAKIFLNLMSIMHEYIYDLSISDNAVHYKFHCIILYTVEEKYKRFFCYRTT